MREIKIDAIFKDGVLKPLEKLDLPEQSRVHLVLHAINTDAPADRPLPGWPRYTPADLDEIADQIVDRARVEAALAKIPGSMVEELRRERQGRL